ncbi:TPA-induced transmembrane protein homolog isoform X1 [Poeciliopsis prolifica]|uniref:TPA-induced transmembrane protein homolog isoform X1 n=1 Tax=Poeciliopsis prolifica TaxID=188132 RepID=UPI002412F17E|nr:TPA-induced transmembrane protein homolog isoform X1 [Poeciliopsis prolifica]
MESGDVELNEIKTISDQKDMVDGQDAEASVVNSLLPESNNGGKTGTKPKHKNWTSLQKCLSLKEKRSKLIAAFIVIFLITIVIVISVSACYANYDDEDEQFDQTTFILQQKFNGSFQMGTPFSNETQGLSDVQRKVTKLYESSHALGRFFSDAEIFHLGNGSAVVQYKLTFIFPEEKLRNSTLSREIVYNVFRQFLYDQNEDEYNILPSSLEMHTMH